MTVTSPKTEHHEGERVSLGPAVSRTPPLLGSGVRSSGSGKRIRDRSPSRWKRQLANSTGELNWRTQLANSTGELNWRTQLERIIARAGLTPWPKLFQNLRSTRETELAETFPLHVVTAWMGNSQLVAAKHYLQVTDQHFAKAIHNQTHSGAEISEPDGNSVVRPPRDNEKAPEFPGLSVSCRDMHNPTVPRRGLEPP